MPQSEYRLSGASDRSKICMKDRLIKPVRGLNSTVHDTASITGGKIFGTMAVSSKNLRNGALVRIEIQANVAASAVASNGGTAGENKRIEQQLIGQRIAVRADVMRQGKLARHAERLAAKAAIEKHQRRRQAQIGDHHADNRRPPRAADSAEMPAAGDQKVGSEPPNQLTPCLSLMSLKQKEDRPRAPIAHRPALFVLQSIQSDPATSYLPKKISRKVLLISFLNSSSDGLSMKIILRSHFFRVFDRRKNSRIHHELAFLGDQFLALRRAYELKI